jgi:hypothetical protein
MTFRKGPARRDTMPDYIDTDSRGLRKRRRKRWRKTIMGRGILLWLIGVPIPIIILLALIWH